MDQHVCVYISSSTRIELPSTLRHSRAVLTSRLQLDQSSPNIANDPRQGRNERETKKQRRYHPRQKEM